MSTHIKQCSKEGLGVFKNVHKRRCVNKVFISGTPGNTIRWSTEDK